MHPQLSRYYRYCVVQLWTAEISAAGYDEAEGTGSLE